MSAGERGLLVVALIVLVEYVWFWRMAKRDKW